VTDATASIGVGGSAVVARPALVLVAGLAGSTEWWRHVAPALVEDDRDVHAVDLPGFGSRGGHRRLLSIVATAELLAEEIAGGAAAGEGGAGDTGGPAPVDLVGYSLGGSVCLRVAAARPELVRRLVLVAPGGVPVTRGAVADTMSLLHMGALAGPGFWPQLARDARRTGLRGLLAAGRDVRTDDATALLPQIAAPTLVVWGDRDTLVPRRDAELISRGISGARLEVLQGIGHVPMAECPEQLAGLIAGFTA
jgi:pimeloyl-ACP methyl ester carboxylesterase